MSVSNISLICILFLTILLVETSNNNPGDNNLDYYQFEAYTSIAVISIYSSVDI